MNYRSQMQEESTQLVGSETPKRCVECGAVIEEQVESILYECEHCMNLRLE